ncbi:MAG: radical SAM protein [Candidatus Aenigmarchaeota archaeon]|nr:radical SAM protein [Candidatus Aenigmarchaeota archaeon]
MKILTIQTNYGRKYLSNKEIFDFLINSKKIFKFVEVGWGENPTENPYFSKIIQVFSRLNLPFTIVTNGDSLKDRVATLDSYELRNSCFSIFLHGKNEKTIKKITGKDTMTEVLESIEYIRKMNIPVDIIMPINRINHRQVEDVFDLSLHYDCRNFIPIEEFPNKDKNMILTDRMKFRVIDSINSLLATGKIIKTIQFHPVEANCSYFRKERIFIDAKGRLSYCHFLSYLENTSLYDNALSACKDKCIIEINNKLRDKFLEEKSKEISTWKKPRKFSSPCSYCLSKFVKNIKW